jgi:hypothetical protein
VWLRKAFEVGGNRMKVRALEDPQLRRVWEES